jgi:tetratricopeptide (TPR) repeat protein
MPKQPHSTNWSPLLVGLLLMFGLGILLLLLSLVRPPVEQSASGASLPNRAILVDEQTCAECHAQEVADWDGSHHEQAMKVASAETVLGDFNDVTFSDAGVTSRFSQKSGQFIVNTIGADGKYADFVVRYTFGITPLQQYLLELPGGHLQAFTIAWDTNQERWFSLYPNQTIPPGDPLHWTSRGFTANSSCISCHTTNTQLNYDLATDSYATTWDAVHVGCQSCHGPGSNHVAWARQPDRTSSDKGLVALYSSLTPQQRVETCAPCHSRSTPISQSAGEGGDFLDNFTPELIREGLYHANGQMLDEVFNYGSFLQSKMYQQGVTCTTCHNPHTLQLRLPGNQMCASCHQLNPPTSAFPTLLAKAYDSFEHHFHEPGSAAAQCASCHMPTTTYMLVDPRHDHSFSIPRPDLTLQWGTPNACASCHADVAPTEQGVAEWAAAAMDRWYGPAWRDRPDITGILTLARQGDPRAALPIQQVISDPAQPAILRATAIELASQYGSQGLAVVASTLNDSSPLVRASGAQALALLPNEQKLLLIAPLLTDPMRSVRIEAVRALASVPQDQLTPAQQQSFTTALGEYEAAQVILADHPEGHVNLGDLYAEMGRMDRAERAYRTAIGRAPDFVPAHLRLATFYYRSGQIAEAEQTFRRAIVTMPNEGSLHYALALLLVEEQRLEEAATSLASAVRLMPNEQRPFYNYGLLLQQLGRITDAERALLRAYELSPANLDTLVALANLYVATQQWDKGLVYAEQLVQLRPDVPQFINLLETIRGEVK